jgi:glycosyltransferase involved in cell wall biosynthesis
MARAGPEIVINGRFLMQPVTGVQRVARELVRAIDHVVAEGDLDLRLRLVCEDAADVTDLDLAMTEVERTGGWSGHAWEQFVLPRHVRGGHLLCLGNTAPLRSLFAAHPTTVMIHDLSYRLFPRAYRLHYRIGHHFMLPFLLRRAAALLTVSETEKAMLCGLRPSARPRVVVAQNGGWREGGHRHGAVDGADDTGHVLYVGSFSARKNIQGVIATAIRLAREDGTTTVLVGASSDILAPIRMAIPPELAPLITLAGQVEDIDQLAALYRGARCLLFPSFYEASPLPPVEAMSFGCPVVVSAIPSMTERCGAAALYCDPDDVEDMVKTVRAAIGSSPSIAEMRQMGYDQAVRFSWRRQAETVIAAMVGAGYAAPTRRSDPAAPAAAASATTIDVKSIAIT